MNANNLKVHLWFHDRDKHMGGSRFRSEEAYIQYKSSSNQRLKFQKSILKSTFKGKFFLSSLEYFMKYRLIQNPEKYLRLGSLRKHLTAEIR